MALRLPPVEPRFERLENYPTSVERHVGDLLGEYDEQELAIEEAKKTVARVLMQGALRSEGRKGIEASGSSPVYDSDHDLSGPDDYTCCEAETDFSPVPSAFWDPRPIGWDQSAVRTVSWPNENEPIVHEFIDVRVSTKLLFGLFPQVVEIADALGVTDRSVRDYIKSGALEAVRLGRLIRIRQSAYERFLRDRSTRRNRPRKGQ